MKHPGLQYQSRMETFATVFARSRCTLAGAESALREAARQLGEMERQRNDVRDVHLANEKALRHLMDMGPSGLARIEGESGPGLTIEQFLVEMDKPQANAVRP